MASWSFIRHGQSIANAERWLAGRRDPALTALGEQQAMQARQGVQAAAFTRAFSSDLQRARRTAEIVLDGSEVPLQVTPALRERSCGDWEGHTFLPPSSPPEGGDLLTTWNRRPPGGESLRDVSIRAIEWLADIDDGSDTLIVAHGALMRSVLGVFDGLPWDRIPHFRPANCELYTREAARGHWRSLLDVALSSPGGEASSPDI